MSATEDDTELRDLLIQNLENNGVLNKLKAEMRAAVFLAMEEQDKLENKTPLINENLKKCLNTKDGRLVAGLIMDFLQVFHLDFSLAVFQPEINSLSVPDSREQLCRDLSLSESELNRNCPLLLELVRRGAHKLSEDPSPKQISLARKKFDFYDQDRSGSVLKEDLKNVFTDLFPRVNQNMLERFITDELRAADRTFCKAIDFQLFVGFYKRLFSQCRSVVVQDSDAPEEKIRPPPVTKDSEGGVCPGSGRGEAPDSRSSSCGLKELLDPEDEPDEGDSFFDDPLPKPQKTYGCRTSPLGGKDSDSQRDLSVLAADRLSEHSPASELRKVEAPGARGSPAGGGSSGSERSHSRTGALNSRERGFRDSKAPKDKTGSLHLEDDDEYDDDFNSHRSDLSKSELSIGEDIEEVSIEGPENSDKFDETTQDLSVSQLSQSHGADYMEEVA